MFIAKVFSRYPWLKGILLTLIVLKVLIATSTVNLNWLELQSQGNGIFSVIHGWIESSETIKKFLVNIQRAVDGFDLNNLIVVVGFVVVAIIIEKYWIKYTKKWIANNGILARAKILEVKYTGIRTGSYHGTTTNFRAGDPIYKVLLEIIPEDGSSYQVEHYEKLSELNFTSWEDGAMIWIKYDPKKPQRIIIDNPSL